MLSNKKLSYPIDHEPVKGALLINCMKNMYTYYTVLQTKIKAETLHWSAE